MCRAPVICPRCRGTLYRDDGEPACVNCGWRQRRDIKDIPREDPRIRGNVYRPKRPPEHRRQDDHRRDVVRAAVARYRERQKEGATCAVGSM